MTKEATCCEEKLQELLNVCDLMAKVYKDSSNDYAELGEMDSSRLFHGMSLAHAVMATKIRKLFPELK